MTCMGLRKPHKHPALNIVFNMAVLGPRRRVVHVDLECTNVKHKHPPRESSSEADTEGVSIFISTDTGPENFGV